MLTITFNILASWLNLIQGLVSYVVYIVLPQAEKLILYSVYNATPDTGKHGVEPN